MTVDLGPERYTLCGATVVEPSTREATSRTLSVVDGRIASPSQAGYPGLPEFRFDGMFVLPGLVDMHVHLVPSLGAGRAVDDEILCGCRSTLADAVRAGVTSIRDVGGDLVALLTLRGDQAAGRFVGSRVFLAGPALCAPGGHGMHSGHGIAVNSGADAAAVVRALAGAGVDHVKLVTSGARGTIQMPADVLRAGVAEARALNLPVAVHAHFQENQLSASIDAGVRSIEHGFLLHRRPDLLDRMAASGTFLCPTLRVVESIHSNPAYGQRIISAAWPDAGRTVAAAAAAGVSLLAGTDSGVYGVRPDHLWREITLLAQHCGSRWEALRAATYLAGKALNRDDLGHLGTGAVADLVLLRRDPVRHDVGVRDVVAVVQNGRLVSGSFNPSEDIAPAE